MNNEEKENFVSFVWARKSLPSTVAAFEQNFKVSERASEHSERASIVTKSVAVECEANNSLLIHSCSRASLKMRLASFCSAQLQKDSKTAEISEQRVVDEYLPHASTCFFSLALPRYSSKVVMRKKLLHAIALCPNMDSDFTTNSAELRSGWM
tara:strand:+ start:222 stop:680 length:459 start_codon:yes stop_codon:yes gene_type:complete